uniref:Phosphoglycerate kinase n=1 Tax=Heterorhabditis bacteriophora TaxID=37862 RepID=A0A1I7WPT0_HETBA
MASGSLLNDIEKENILAFSDIGLNRPDIVKGIAGSMTLLLISSELMMNKEIVPL